MNDADARVMEYILMRVENIDEKMDKKLAEINTKIDDLNSFRWKVIGAGAAVGFIVSFIAKFIKL